MPPLGGQLPQAGFSSSEVVRAHPRRWLSLKSVLFVCLGNICWSFTTKVVFRKLTLGENISHNRAINNRAIPSAETGMEPGPTGCEHSMKPLYYSVT